MLVRIRLFAMLRERAGVNELELELPEGARVSDALERVQDLAAAPPLVVALNRVSPKPARSRPSGVGGGTGADGQDQGARADLEERQRGTGRGMGGGDASEGLSERWRELPSVTRLASAIADAAAGPPGSAAMSAGRRAIEL